MSSTSPRDAFLYITLFNALTRQFPIPEKSYEKQAASGGKLMNESCFRPGSNVPFKKMESGVKYDLTHGRGGTSRHVSLYNCSTSRFSPRTISDPAQRAKGAQVQQKRGRALNPRSRQRQSLGEAFQNIALHVIDQHLSPHFIQLNSPLCDVASDVCHVHTPITRRCINAHLDPSFRRVV